MLLQLALYFVQIRRDKGGVVYIRKGAVKVLKTVLPVHDSLLGVAGLDDMEIETEAIEPYTIIVK